MGLRQRHGYCCEVEDRAAQAAWGAGRPAHTTLAAQAPRGAGGRFTGPRTPDVAALQAGVGRRGV